MKMMMMVHFNLPACRSKFSARSTHIVSVASLGLELLGEVIEADPTLSVLNIAELLQYFLLAVTGSLHHTPEVNEFVKTDLAIVVNIDLAKELIGGNSTERALPMLEGLVLVNCIAAIDIENTEHLSHTLVDFR